MALRNRDTIDRQLLALLEENARMSTADIAREIHLARSTVHERIGRLERDGVIIGYSAIVVRAQDDEVTRALAAVATDQQHVKTIVTTLKKFPEIRSCHSTIGTKDLICFVETPCLEDLDALIDDIAALAHVRQVETTILLATKFDRINHYSGGHSRWSAEPELLRETG